MVAVRWVVVKRTHTFSNIFGRGKGGEVNNQGKVTVVTYTVS